MQKVCFFILSLILTMVAGCSDCDCCPEVAKIQGVVVAGAQLELIQGDFSFTEGPACDYMGNLYFTDQPNDRIMRYTTDGKMETFMQPAGRANGLYFDHYGNLLACADEKGEIWQIDIKTKEYKVLASKYNGTRLNATNDIWVHPDGNIYFSDPFFARQWWDHNTPTQDKQCVYCINRKTGQLVRVTDDLLQPNGLIGTPDGKTLYVTDFKAEKIYRYNIKADGTLADKQLFCNEISDGMTIDSCGNIYITNGKGVTVFDQQGRQIKRIPVPSSWTANVTFGGVDNKTLFITAQKSVFALKMNVGGVR